MTRKTVSLGSIGRELIVTGGLAGLLASAAAAQIVEPVQYQLFDLGTLGGSGSMALAVNDLGQVVGWSETESGQVHGFMWEDGVMSDLGVLSTRFSEARDINNAGQIVGVSKNSELQQRAVYWFDGLIHDLSWCLVFTLTLPPDQYPRLFEANAINDDGSIVAVGTIDADPDVVRSYLLIPLEQEVFNPYDPRYEYVEIGFLPQESSWQTPQVGHDAGPPQTPAETGPAATFAYGLNDMGEVVGESYGQAFMWDDDDGVAELELGVFESRARAINFYGIAVGWLAGPSGEQQATLWSKWMPGEHWALYTPPGWISEASDVNDATRSVGWAADNPIGLDASAMLWIGTAAYDLNSVTAIPESPVFWEHLEEATSINSADQIVGYGVMTGGQARAFLLEPMDMDGQQSDD